MEFKNKLKNILPGILLIAAGGGYLGDVLGLWNFSIFFDGWWTLFIIVPCLMNIIEFGPGIFNVIGILFGAALFMSSWQMISMALVWKALLPILLIALGIKIIFFNSIPKDFDYKGAKSFSKNAGSSDPGMRNFFAVFGGTKPNFDNMAFYGCNCYSVFGGVDIDLRNSVIHQDCIINCYAIFGGIDIILPLNLKVKTSSIPIFGGVSNKYSSTTDEFASTVYIRSTALFGGVEIK